ncbi:hypothetical protein DN069_04755 [Streptacidiphilus pinicola]|uniref:Uncharacterized protein n=1 Tax=Streptacidiphilus pinicola TaxID=2219663 RepID=A0A2X0INR2_9ACTN|nr:hypothetical protein [Streptacidiphilus pinicola]RAG86842.1 hypothetical protein DN069_04755 [Streptacidiphilus pinicola]
MSLYYCPTVREVEHTTEGGFDVCCAHPELHVPMPDTEATAVVSDALDQAKRREFRLGRRAKAAEAALRKVRAELEGGGVPTRKRLLKILERAEQKARG